MEISFYLRDGDEEIAIGHFYLDHSGSITSGKRGRVGDHHNRYMPEKVARFLIEEMAEHAFFSPAC
jgi:hypothetical protein